MTLQINGESREIDEAPLSVALLLETLGLSERPMLVEINGEALRPRDYASHVIHDGDTLEIIQIVAGG